MDDTALTGDPPAPDLAAASDRYAARFRGPVGEWMLARQTRVIEAFVADIPGTILDVGGGHGQITPGLARLGREVTALVSSEAAAGKLRSAGGGAAYQIGRVDELDLAPRSVDIVIAVRLLAHAPDWRRCLASLCRVARRAVIVDFANARGLNAASGALFGLKRRIEGDTREFRIIRSEEIAAVLAANGFAGDRHVGQFVVPMAAHRLLRSLPVSRASEAALAGLAPRFGNPVLLRALCKE